MDMDKTAIPTATAAFDVDSLAQQLFAARTTRSPVTRPAAMSKEQAALVKAKTLELLSQRGSQKIVGYKVSKSYSWGAFTADRVLSSPAKLARAAFFDPVVETEAVFLLDADIGADATLEFIVANSRVAAGIELADSRWRDWYPSDLSRFVKPNEAEIEADNALGSWMIIGGDAPAAASLPLPDVRVSAVRDGTELASGSLSFVMGHPAEVVRWLAGALAASNRSLRAGDFVSTGNPYRNFVTGQAGSTYTAAIDGVGKASVTFD